MVPREICVWLLERENCRIEISTVDNTLIHVYRNEGMHDVRNFTLDIHKSGLSPSYSQILEIPQGAV